MSSSFCHQFVVEATAPGQTIAMPSPTAEIHLYRHAETAWREIVRPWLSSTAGRLTRSYLVVPTRAQAYGIKQRALIDNLPLLGVEFLTPGLARQKWLALGNAQSSATPAKPAMGRELLLLGLQNIIHRHLEAAGSDVDKSAPLKTLQSDVEHALDDFDELLRAGFDASAFGSSILRTIFRELTTWVSGLGYELSPVQAELAVMGEQKSNIRIPGRILVHGFSAELRGEFFNTIGFAQYIDDITVTLPEPEFRGNKMLDEAWIELWENALGTVATPIDEIEAPESCDTVAEVWSTAANSGAPVALELPSSGQTCMLTGMTRSDEMRLVAQEITKLLDHGATNIGVIFPHGDAPHLYLSHLLQQGGIPFADMLETAGPPALETRAQRALIKFHANGARLDELVELWPLLRATGFATQPLSAARDVCERLFDKRQTHALSAYKGDLEGIRHTNPAWAEVARIAQIILPGFSPWPSLLTPTQILELFCAQCVALDLGDPAQELSPMQSFASRESSPLPTTVLLGALDSFLQSKSTVASAPGHGCFARVTLTTRRRAEGLPWSHLILVESNAGVWPMPHHASCWLPDHLRTELAKQARPSHPALLNSDDAAWLERRGYAALARDTEHKVIFSAALFDEENPEIKLGPNSWLERLRWRLLAHELGKPPPHDEIFENHATGVESPRRDNEPDLQDQKSEEAESRWHQIYLSRRNPTQPFDDYFFSVNPEKFRPQKLAASLIEAGVGDPSELWFSAILEADQVSWVPLEKTRAKYIGQLSHRVLAAAMSGTDEKQHFAPRPTEEEARARLDHELKTLRQLWPQNAYWDSFHTQLSHNCKEMLAKVFVIAATAGGFIATEMPLPAGACVPLGPSPDHARLNITGRVDLVLMDKTDWPGASVHIIDFKTGGNAKLSVRAMADRGSALQLGLYLSAACSLGARGGRVWMVKPDMDEPSSIGTADLPMALHWLEQIEKHMQTGRYGALTVASDYSAAGRPWPIANPLIPQSILKKKFKLTFPSPDNAEDSADTEAQT